VPELVSYPCHSEISLTRKHVALLLLLTILAVLVHGYHPAVEDGEIYLPGIKKDLNPALYPFGDQFFMSHARMTLFDEVIATSIRISHAPFDYVVFVWHLACIFVFLAGCWRVGQSCFAASRAAWGGTVLVAALLTLPVAGTALYILDPYLTTRDLSTAGIMLVIANALERRFARAGLWTLAIGAIHPLMIVFAIVLLAILYLEQRGWGAVQAKLRAAGAKFALFLPVIWSLKNVSPEYRQALDTRAYFFLLRWAWYEWLGVIGPLALLCWLAHYGQAHGLPKVRILSRALIVFELIFFAVALLLAMPSLLGMALLQPMRCLHLVFILLFVLLGGVLAEQVLKNAAWRWVVLFVPLCLAMFAAQRALYPSTEHLELPGRTPQNLWVQAFEWIRQHTPRAAIFALDPRHMTLAGEDQHGFRALAERSMLADAVKDSGAVTMFPALAVDWREQVDAQLGWSHFQAQDFQRLRRKYGVSWVVLQQPGVAGLACPYQNAAVVVCRVE